MLIQNVHVDNQKDAVDVRIEDGKFAAIKPGLSTKPGEEVIDGQGKVLLPPFIDSHVHLDATLTAGQPEWNETGTLVDGIRIALQALLELKHEMQDVVDLQLVAFPQEGILSYPHGKKLMKQAVKEGADVVGGIPHFEFTTEYGWKSVKFLVKLAEKYDKLVDVHCDEIDDPASRNLEVLATMAYKTGLADMVTASHTTAMGSYNDAYTYKLFRLLKMSNINFVSNPLVNMHLGGRFDTYPKRRGLTRIKELDAANINVSFGEDDIQDPWNPLGNGNMLDSVSMGVYAAHLMGYSQLQDSFKFVTYNAAKTLHIADRYGIKEGLEANCILLNAEDFYNALNKHVEVLYNIRRGKVLAKTTPAETTLNLPDSLK